MYPLKQQISLEEEGKSLPMAERASSSSLMHTQFVSTSLC